MIPETASAGPRPAADGAIRGDPRADFPAIPTGWHYLDSAATAQKPQTVIEAIARAYDRDYASVHRGVYARSADMTIAYEAARATVARFLGARGPDEVIFTRGATEAINLVAQSWGASTLKAGDRILLSALEHHANIVPWQMLRDTHGIVIDVAPLTADGQIDLDAAEAILSPDHKLIALAHVSNVLGSVLDGARAARMARKVGARLLLDGCQAVPRLAVDVGALDCDFYVFSAHKLYGPTGIGALWARAELLEGMPPVQGGGAMIDRVSFEHTSFAPPPGRFEAGTPHIVGAIGLAAAIHYVEGFGLGAIDAHERALVRQTRAALRGLDRVTIYGPQDAAGIVSFNFAEVHPHDVATLLDEAGVAVRAGHHCAQPLMNALGAEATVRASFGIYSGADDVAALIDGLSRVGRIFG